MEYIVKIGSQETQVELNEKRIKEFAIHMANELGIPITSINYPGSGFIPLTTKMEIIPVNVNKREIKGMKLIDGTFVSCIGSRKIQTQNVTSGLDNIRKQREEKGISGHIPVPKPRHLQLRNDVPQDRTRTKAYRLERETAARDKARESLPKLKEKLKQFGKKK